MEFLSEVENHPLIGSVPLSRTHFSDRASRISSVRWYTEFTILNQIEHEDSLGSFGGLNIKYSIQNFNINIQSKIIPNFGTIFDEDCTANLILTMILTL